MGRTRGSFEIWFFVAIDPDAARAIWIRHTRLTPALREGACAINWAATFAGESAPLALKNVRMSDAMVVADDGARVTLDGAALEADGAHGRVTVGAHTIAWDLCFAASRGPVKRSPKLVSSLPLPVHAEHLHARTPIEGTYEVDGKRVTLGPRSRMVEARIWGERQADEIFWIWAPAFADVADGGMELVAARPRTPGVVPRVASLVLDADGFSIDGTSLARTMRTRVTLVRPGVVEVRLRARDVEIVVRAHAEQFVGYIYRGPDEPTNEVHVAQSDVATCEVSVFRRRTIGLRLERVLHAPVAALEIHQREPLPGIRYLGWEEEADANASANADASANTNADANGDASGDANGSMAMPAITDVLALGLTYADHIRETGSAVPAEPIVFRKALGSVLREGERVRAPSHDEMLAALAAIEPGLDEEVRKRFPVLPPLMDYEVELGLVLLEDADATDLERADFSPARAWFLANDLTARSCQILGEGMADPYAYWAVAKSFDGFLPVSRRALRVRGSLDERVDLALLLRVNGELRQDGRTSDLVYTQRQMLLAAARHLVRDGRGTTLPRGLALITGTPSGVGLAVPRWKKAIADRVLDRFGKLRAAIGAHARGGKLLRAGDEIVFEASTLGSRRVVLV
jgi:2-keto-4-pentenoate hydratase/2-oxohepta-3-ene-1,7-dioic acid hydratase in catechol pathway